MSGSASPSPALPPLGFRSNDPSALLTPQRIQVGVAVPFTRPAGDAANPRTWPFPLLREEAASSTLDRLVNTAYTPQFTANVVATAHRLADRGCVGVITDCGFLALLQQEVAEAVAVPVAISSLCQLPSVLGWVPRGKGVGVVTYNGEKLGKEHFRGVGVREEDLGRLWVVGIPEKGVLRRIVEEARKEYDLVGVEREIVQLVKEMVRERPETAAVLLECTQMAPFAEAVQREVGLPVYDVFTLGCWFYSGLVRRRPEYWGPADGTGPYT